MVNDYDVMFLVGLTGSIASGKSTVTNFLKNELGCSCVVDADVIARQVVHPGKPAYYKIRKEFGEEILLSDGSLDREKLGQIVFNDDDKRKKLNLIVHPEIKKQMLWEIFLLFIKGYQFVILDIPLLFETKTMLPYISYSLVVFCHEDQQLQRLMKRNNMTEAEARARINTQLPMVEKCKLATYTIDNTKSILETKEQVRQIYEKLCASKRHFFVRFFILSGFISLISAFYILF